MLQNATDIITMCREQCTTILLQNATVIAKWDVYYKLRQYSMAKSIDGGLISRIIKILQYNFYNDEPLLVTKISNK